MNVFIYTRVSTGQQTDGDGFGRQRTACKEFCAAKGWNVLRVFEETVSGSKETIDRPLLTEAIALCGSALDVCTIVVERADRIGRDLVVSELFFRECRKKGIQVYAADCQEELVMSDADPTRKLIRQILGALAEWDKAQIVAKLQAGRRRKKAMTGKHCGGPEGFGYQEAHKPTVRFILFRYRRGDSSRQISRALRYGPGRVMPRPTADGFITHNTVNSIVERFNHRPEYINIDDPLESLT